MNKYLVYKILYEIIPRQFMRKIKIFAAIAILSSVALLSASIYVAIQAFGVATEYLAGINISQVKEKIEAKGMRNGIAISECIDHGRTILSGAILHSPPTKVLESLKLACLEESPVPCADAKCEVDKIFIAKKGGVS